MKNRNNTSQTITIEINKSKPHKIIDKTIIVNKTLIHPPIIKITEDNLFQMTIEMRKKGKKVRIHFGND